jgi:cob(I)alamin adenosyltransferase
MQMGIDAVAQAHQFFMATAFDHIAALHDEMRSASRTAERRWAMMSTVRPAQIWRMLSWMIFSDS